jgi:hypothetical protein
VTAKMKAALERHLESAISILLSTENKRSKEEIEE